MSDLLEPTLEYVFELRVAVADPRFAGEVLAGGGDWWVTRGDTTQLDARYLIRSHDGAVIDVVNRGYFRASAELGRRHEAGEEITEAELYYRTAPVFQTDAPDYLWMTGHQFIGMARPEPGFVCIRVFMLL